MRGFFNPDNWLWRGFGRLADYFTLSICWLFCSVPLITVGSASIALYDTVAHCLRGGEGDMLKRFFGTFKKELGRGVLLTLLWAVLCYGLNVGYQIICQLSDGSNIWTVFSIVYFVTLFVPLSAMSWLIALESRFTYKFGQLHKNAFLFTFGCLPQSFLIVLILVVVLNALIIFPFLVMLLPAVMVHLQSGLTESVFKKYMSAEEDMTEAPEVP